MRPLVAFLHFLHTNNWINATLGLLRTLACNVARVLLWTMFLGVAVPVSAQTVSSKFIPTFLIYYGGGAPLTAQDAQALAKFELIDIDRYRYNSISPTTWAAVKSINPNTEFYLYEMGPEASNAHDATGQLYLNELGRYGVSRGHPLGSLNGNHPDLFVPDIYGKRLYDAGPSNSAANQYFYLMDFGSAVYQSYWLTAVQADIVNQPWVGDGVFADNCSAVRDTGKYSGTPAWYASDPSWSGAMNSFASAISAGLHSYGQKLWCNRGGTSSTDGSTAWLTLDSSANPPDVLLEDGAFAAGRGAAVQFFAEADWKRQLDTMAAIKHSKVAMLSQTQLLAGQSGADNNGKPVTYWQALWYAMGSFLLGKNDELGNAYFMFAGGTGYNRIWWHDEYDHIDLGKALGAYAVTAVGGVNVYSREFQRGYLYVNPTANDAAATLLPQAAQQLTHDNLLSPSDSIAFVNTITVAAHSAAILLKDTTAPTVPTGLTATATSATSINIAWNAATDNVGVKGYHVSRSGSVGISSVMAPATSLQQTSLTPGTTYTYYVSAFDSAGNTSGRAAVQITTPLRPETNSVAAIGAVPVPVPVPSPQPTRDALKWPFRSSSIWNMPIGSNAVFAAAGLHFDSNVASGSATYWYDMPQADRERIILAPSSPITNVYINNVGWSGGDRCVQQGALYFNAPIPAAYVLPNSTANNGAAILMPDGKTVTQTQPFTKCAGYAYATSMVPWSISMWQYDIKAGDGTLGAHGASQLSTLGGTIRLGELRPGTQMRHALKVNVFSSQDLGLCASNMNNCFTWPAVSADGWAANVGSGYGSLTNNANPYMKMGALLAIPASVDINNLGLKSAPGKMLAWTLQNYGAYIVDSRSSPGFDLSVEDGAAGSKLDEFKADFGFPFEGRLGYATLRDANGASTPQAQWVQDVILLVNSLRVVTNNRSSSIGGGGSPRQPLAPPFN